MKFLKNVFIGAVGFFAVLGLVVFLLVVGVASMFKNMETGPTHLPAQIVLELDLSKGVKEFQGARSFSDFSTPTLRQIIQAIDRGTNDSAVQGLVVDLSGNEGLGFAQTQELR